MYTYIRVRVLYVFALHAARDQARLTSRPWPDIGPEVLGSSDLESIIRLGVSTTQQLALPNSCQHGN